MNGHTPARYSWSLYESECQSDGYGAEQLLASSDKLFSMTLARSHGMAALLARKRQRHHAADLPSADVGSGSGNERAYNWIVSEVRARIAELSRLVGVVDLCIAELQGTSIPLKAPDEYPRLASTSEVHAPGTWRLLEKRFVLLVPEGASIDLSKAQHALLVGLFRAPNRQLTYMQASEAIADALHKEAISPGSLNVIVNRLRAKFRARGVSLPLHTVRGKGYSFSAEAAVWTV